MTEKRKKFKLTKEEFGIVLWLFKKYIFFIIMAVAIELAVLFFGIKFLITNISFPNYGVFPSLGKQFFNVYFHLSVITISVIVFLGLLVSYISFKNIVMPLFRIKREVEKYVDTKQKVILKIRKSEYFLHPIVDAINKIIHNK
ncbi:MAG: hypothetical protein ABID79_04735 [Elusimicrobiota bacterium]